jgi:beta-1,4-N-acetylglucosaminyltransferase
MIFVTLGANPHPFTRLAKKMDEMVGNGEIKEEIIMQLGTTSYKLANIKKFRRFYNTGAEYERILNDCSLIISHAGLGNIMKAQKYRKPIIVVPRQKKYNEHIDDHQSEIARYMEKRGMCIAVYDLKNLKEKIIEARRMKLKYVRSAPSEAVKMIKQYVERLMS